MTGVLLSLLSFIRENGLGSFIEEIANRSKLWDLDESEFQNLGSGSSFSDNREYLSIVEVAAQNEHIFQKFRSNRQYRKILEHVTKSLAEEYLKLIPETEKKNLIKLNECDVIGGPLRYRFGNYGLFSPTTIRYLFFNAQYKKYFGELTNLNVIEIGGGFGGQAAVSLKLNPTISWTIFDLPEVLTLQEKFLSAVNLRGRVNFQSGLKISVARGDLLISNYALSEISRDLQLKYFKLVVSNCQKGYMAWNTISEKENGGLTLTEVLNMIPGSNYVDEIPNSSPGNVIIYWGNQSAGFNH